MTTRDTVKLMELVRGTIIPFEEDKEYEFKMHLDLCEDDLPVWLRMPQRKRTRRAISRYFLEIVSSQPTALQSYTSVVVD